MFNNRLYWATACGKCKTPKQRLLNTKGVVKVKKNEYLADFYSPPSPTGFFDKDAIELRMNELS